MIGICLYFFRYILIVGSSNAVNLTDGLDGLATVPVILVSLTFVLIAYLVGNIIFVRITHAESSITIAILWSIIGACLGFLWFNAPPAKIFMGDTGSLALGAFLGTVSLITKHEIALMIAGGFLFWKHLQ